MARQSRRRKNRAFTLIELLVVITVIALLVSLLLPALAKSRETARTTICGVNMKQIMLAFTSYANDYKTIPGGYWQGPLNLDWCGRNNVSYNPSLAPPNHPIRTSVLFEYVQGADKIIECPSARREANKYYDYTMIIRMAGARLDLPWQGVYQASPPAATPLKRFPAIPLIVEEHDRYYNRQNDDGSFANLDQFSTRHGVREAGSEAGGRGGGCHIGLFDGGIMLFKPPVGPNNLMEEASDLTCRKIFLIKKGTATLPLDSSSAAEWGWVNRTQ